MKIVKRMKQDGTEYVLVKGIKGKTKLKEIAKKYGKKYQRRAFSTTNIEKDGLVLSKRKKKLKKAPLWRSF